MKRIPWVVAAIGAAMMAAAWALAQTPPQEPAAKPLPPDRFAMAATPRQRVLCESRDAVVAGALAFMRARLAIESAQEPAWGRFTEAVQRSTAPLARLCAGTAGRGAAPTTLPDILAGKERSLEATLQVLKSIRPAVGDLYAVLTPEQAQRLDELPPLLFRD